MLPNDVSRCDGWDCPCRMECARYTDKGTGTMLSYITSPFHYYDYCKSGFRESCEYMIAKESV